MGKRTKGREDKKTVAGVGIDWPMRLFTGVVAGWMLLYWIQSILAVKHNYLATPIWDYWMTVMHLQDYRNFNFTVLWQQHNEHRVILPELMFALDFLLFQGREIFPVVMSVLLYAGTAGFLCWAFSATNRIPRDIAILAGLLTGTLLGWPGIAITLSSPFLLQWTLFAAVTALAFWQTAVSATSDRRMLHLCLAISGGAAATYSSANGLAVWPILLIAAFWLRLRWRDVALLAVAGLIFSSLFFAGYNRNKDAQPLLIVKYFVLWVEFVGCYLGVPFSYIDNRVGIVMGWLQVAATVGFCWRLRKDDIRGEPAAVVYVGFALITLATAFLTSISRLNPGDAGLGTAKPARYLILPLFTWAGVILMSVYLACRRPAGRKLAIWLLCGYAATMVAVLPRAKAWIMQESDIYARDQLASLSVETGLEDKQLIENQIYPVAEWPHRLLPMLRQERSSLYADSRFLWLGRDFQDRAIRKEPTEIPGQIVVNRAVQGGVELLGWFDGDSDTHEHVLVDESGRVVGLGARLDAGLPLELKVRMPEKAQVWAGFVNLQWHSKSVRAWAFSPDRKRFNPMGSEIQLR